MSKYYSTTLRIISTIILIAFISTQVAWGYEGRATSSQPQKSHLRVKQAKGSAVGDEIANVLGAKFEDGKQRDISSGEVSAKNTGLFSEFKANTATETAIQVLPDIVLGTQNIDGIPKREYIIISPVYNEGSQLESIIYRASKTHYLDKVIFVDDASTDNSADILRARPDVRAMFLSKNQKKEGAIKQVLLYLESIGKLPEAVIILDADSNFYYNDKDGEDVLDNAIKKSVDFMREHNFVALRYNIQVSLDHKKITFLQRIQNVEYSFISFFLRAMSWFGYQWVISGAGGVFETQKLLEVLKKENMDFETGDLMVTVALQKKGYRVGYYKDLVVKTSSPATFKELFKQRLRWQRGALRTFFKEKMFFLRNMMKMNLIGIFALLYLTSWPIIAFSVIRGDLHALIKTLEINSILIFLMNLITPEIKYAKTDKMWPVFSFFVPIFILFVLFFTVPVALYQVLTAHIFSKKNIFDSVVNVNSDTVTAVTSPKSYTKVILNNTPVENSEEHHVTVEQPPTHSAATGKIQQAEAAFIPLAPREIAIMQAMDDAGRIQYQLFETAANALGVNDMEVQRRASTFAAANGTTEEERQKQAKQSIVILIDNNVVTANQTYARLLARGFEQIIDVTSLAEALRQKEIFDESGIIVDLIVDNMGNDITDIVNKLHIEASNIMQGLVNLDYEAVENRLNAWLDTQA